MRTVLAAALLIALSTPAGAQSHARSTVGLPASSIGLPLPSIGLPLPPMGLPLPPMGLSPRTVAPSDLNPFRGDRAPRTGGGRSNRRGVATGGAVFLFVPAYGWPYVPDSLLPGTPVPGPPSPPVAPRAATGRLHLALQSGVDPQIYVDGYYVGMLSDASGELTLEAGAHTLELRQDGYDALHVDIQIPVDGLITYRATMRRVVAAPAAVAQAPPASNVPPPAPPAPSTIYMIPGCYVGNVPPKDASLPAGCDEGRAIAFPSRP
jgi:hypothetical protein